MFLDVILKLYLIFAIPVVLHFEWVNKIFQSDDYLVEKLVKSLDHLHQYLKERLLDRQGQETALSLVQLGASFDSEALKVIAQQGKRELFQEWRRCKSGAKYFCWSAGSS